MITVTYNNYEELASTTCKDIGNVSSNILHMKMGIITEAAEVIDILKKKHAYDKEIDKAHLREEIGDIFWYVANYCKIMELDFAGIIDNVRLDPLYDEKNNFSLYQTMEYIINNTLTLDEHSIVDVVDLLMYAINLTEEDLNEVLRINIRKLQARYPEGFSSYYALNRTLDNEKKIING